MPYAQTAVAIVAAVDNTFNDLIDIRDWENLDYILYCLETRRADNMKEALAAVDRQRQTEQIVSAVEAAGKEISRTLRRLRGLRKEWFNASRQYPINLNSSRVSWAR